MTQSLAMVAAGTAAATLTAILLLLRTTRIQRPVLALARKWTTLKWHATTLAIVPLTAITALCFAHADTGDASMTSDASISALLATAPSKEDADLRVTGGPEARERAVKSLRAYAARIAAKRQTNSNLSMVENKTPNAGAEALADVDTMISLLAARLDKEPGDAKGWKMLGWSYLNTGKTADAIRAYEAALALTPDDDEIKASLEAAKSAKPESTTEAAASAAPGPSAEEIKAAEGLAGDQRNDMIRGMVTRLATRLESSPNDEDGWVRLMRARMVLGELDAAKAALAKARETFAADTAVKDRLTASARELGVESN